MIITSLTDFNVGLDEYPKHLKGKKLHKWILNNLKHRKRVSCFEIDADLRMARTVMFLNRIGKITFNEDFEYPYTGVTVN